MKKSSDTWHTKKVDDFQVKCKAAAAVLMRFAEIDGRKNNRNWNFQECFANFDKGAITAIFNDSTTVGSHYSLSVIAYQSESGDWECTLLQKKISQNPKAPSVTQKKQS
jgi:hypothetical protein